MKDERRYMVFRVYTEEERPASSEVDRSRFYGWSYSKDVIKVFLTQRSKSKYVTKRMYEEDIARIYSENGLDSTTKIDYIPLTVASTGKVIHLFMTKYELKEAEIRIQKYFRNICRIIDRPGYTTKIFELFLNIVDYYAEALDYIGFKPPEVDQIYDVAMFRGCCTEEDMVEWDIDEAYNMTTNGTIEPNGHDDVIPGLRTITNVANKILYSAENFIMVLREDM